MESMKDRIEAKVLEFSGKLSTQIHLLALRNTFMTILPIMVFGGLSAVISAARMGWLCGRLQLCVLMDFSFKSWFYHTVCCTWYYTLSV